MNDVKVASRWRPGAYGVNESPPTRMQTQHEIPLLPRLIAWSVIACSALLLAGLCVPLASTSLTREPLAVGGLLAGALITGIGWFLIAGTPGRALAAGFMVLAVAASLSAAMVSPEQSEPSFGISSGDGLIAMFLGSMCVVAVLRVRHFSNTPKVLLQR